LRSTFLDWEAPFLRRRSNGLAIAASTASKGAFIMTSVTRRSVIAGIAIAAGWGPTKEVRAAEKVFRIAFQKGATNLVLLKERGTIEEALKPQGWMVTWAEFPAGPQLLESLNIGAADFGPVGDTPPIFAQAAGADIVYVGHEAPSPRNNAIIVPKDSPIKTIADLKGKQVAYARGSSCHWLVVRALEANGLTYGDVQSDFLTPADARAAFERGAVDAWAIWDPYYAAVQIDLGARTVADGTGLTAAVGFYIAARPFAEQHPEVIGAALTALRDIDIWLNNHPGEAAAEMSRRLGLKVEVLQRGFERSVFGVSRVDAATLAEQQKIADAFAKLGLIPKPINVRDAEWKAAS
jgi:sulfonate transport system substrate-binding protein